MPDYKRMTKAQKAAVLDFYHVPHSIKPAAPRKAPVSREGPVVRAVLELLQQHPATALVVRQNSGGASYEHSSGRYAPIMFYTLWKPTNKEVTISDVWGILKDGRPYAFECKAPGWTKPRDDREYRQAAFLMLIRNLGGIGEFITSADQVQALLAVTGQQP